MVPSSEELEALHDRVNELNAALAKLRGAELTRTELIDGLAAVAKDWLRLSPSLKAGAEGFLPSLEPYDAAMSEVLTATKQRSRSSAYQARLRPFLDSFLDAVVVPLIRFEGSPGQVAERQLEAVFEGVVKPDEFPYIQEAARCSGVHCHRAAIVLLWAAAMARLHNSIQALGFGACNSAATSALTKKGAPFNRISKGFNVSSLPELQKSRDFDVLAVGLELWKYDLQAFEELDRLLGIRNSAAHPGMFQPGALDVRQFAEKLRRYVFEIVK